VSRTAGPASRRVEESAVRLGFGDSRDRRRGVAAGGGSQPHARAGRADRARGLRSDRGRRLDRVTSARLARRVGDRAARIATWLKPSLPERTGEMDGDAFVRFRDGAIDLIRRGGPFLRLRRLRSA
jgi:hypothetical protein